MKSITLNNGFEYRAWWGGSYRRPLETPKTSVKRGITISGDCCELRKYHNLRLVNEGGREWIIEHQRQGGSFTPSKSLNHMDIKSTDGKYHIARYRDQGGYGFGFIYLIYEAYTWRENMQSTFGDHVRGIGAKEFRTAKEAMEALTGK